MKTLSKKEKSILFSLYLFNPIRVVGGVFRSNENSRNEKGEVVLSPSIVADCWEGTFQFEDFELKLKKIENLSEEDLQQLWVVIGGTPHLFGFGKDDFKECIISGEWETSGFQLDYFTIEKITISLRELGYDLDEMIYQGFAKEII